MPLPIRKICLLSFAAISTLSLAPGLSPVLPHPLSILASAPAFARAGGGSSDHGSGGEGADHDGGEAGDHAGDASGSAAGGAGSHESETEHEADDDADQSTGTGGRHGSEPGENETENHRHGGGVPVSISPDSLEGLKNGTLRAEDALGRALEIEIENEHGSATAKARLADPGQISQGPITGVKVVPVR